MAQMAGESIVVHYTLFDWFSRKQNKIITNIMPMSREPEFFGLNAFVKANYQSFQGNIFVVGLVGVILLPLKSTSSYTYV